VKDIFDGLLHGLSRWPLLLGAVVCYALAVYEEMMTDNSEVAIAVTGVVVGSVLLGAWLVSYVIAGERTHYAKHAPIWRKESPPPKDEGPSEDC
jgi:ABC-type Fe3+ transport system permease subunit